MIAWLLDPCGRHGLKAAFLSKFLDLVGCGPYDPDSLLAASTRTEVTRGKVRADILVRLPGACVLVEAKVDAEEHDDQCKNLDAAFEDEPGIKFVFLTPDGREPSTLGAQPEATFLPLGFGELRDALEEAIRVVEAERVNPAVLTYLDTMGVEFK